MISKSAIAKVDPETTAALVSACEVLEDMGHRVEPLDVDSAAILVDVVMGLIVAGIASTPMENPALMDPVVRHAWEAGRKSPPAGTPDS